jgi:hypothetical protein
MEDRSIILTGRDAKRFRDNIKNPVKVSKEELQRMRENYKMFKLKVTTK